MSRKITYCMACLEEIYADTEEHLERRYRLMPIAGFKGDAGMLCGEFTTGHSVEEDKQRARAWRKYWCV